jgi:hypothetical protein
MVFDDVAEEDRDVDITLRVVNEDAGTTLLEGIEVKHHKRPLDVSHVEQLCAKLRDMPAIGNAGIVSGSGYTEPAVKKAKHHGVTLYSLVNWPAPMRLGDVCFNHEFAFRECNYEWVGQHFAVFNPSSPALAIEPSATIFDRFGAPLADTPTCSDLPEFLASQAPAIAARQGSPLEFNLGETKWTEIDITLGDEPFVLLGGSKVTLERVRIGGQMAYSERSVPPIFKAFIDT